MGFLRRWTIIPDLRNGVPTPLDCHSGPPERGSYAVGLLFRTSGTASPSLRPSNIHLGIRLRRLGETREGKGTTIHRDFVPGPSDFFIYFQLPRQLPHLRLRECRRKQGRSHLHTLYFLRHRSYNRRTYLQSIR